MIPVEIRPDPLTLAADLAAVLAARLGGLTASAQRVDLAVAGGFVSQVLLPALADHAELVDWSRVHVWWADERYVAADDPQRNDAEAIEALLGRVEGATLHRMPADEGGPLEEAGLRFGAEWSAQMQGRRLDLAILGMGPDGHVASLFPGRPLTDSSPVAVISDSPKPPPRRITLTMPVFLAARELVIAAPGASKAPVIAESLRLADSGAPVGPEHPPVARILRAGASVWTDAAGAAALAVRGE